MDNLVSPSRRIYRTVRVKQLMPVCCEAQAATDARDRQKAKLNRPFPMPIASGGFIVCVKDGRTHCEVGLFHSMLTTDKWPNCPLAEMIMLAVAFVAFRSIESHNHIHIQKVC